MNLEFKNIEVDDIDIMMPYYMMRKNRTCDSVFLESFIWKEFYKVRYAIWEDKAILWLMEYDGNCFSAMPLCREEDLPDAFKAIETYFNEELGYPLIINLADEYAVEYLKLPENEYNVKEQVDSKDYLYTGDSMRTLAGKKLHKKKNHVNSFIRRYEGQVEYRALCCSDSHLVWELLDSWKENKGEGAEEHLEYEVRGIHDILKNCSNLNIRMGGVFIDDKLEAFTMGSYNPVENMAVIHIEKANSEINGLYQYINQQFLLAEFPTVEWVNREDDLGIEGLRKSKMSYYPADFARKYLVEQIMDGKHDYQWAEEIGNTMAGEETVYLSSLEADVTRKMWHDSFPEDSEGFMDYYYEEKIKDNKMLIKKQNGFVISMLHLNPYQVKLKETVRDISYIVGVATDGSHRREGHMSDILIRALKEMEQEQVPFTFLMPAAKEIYLPFSFAYIGTQPVWKLKDAAAQSLKRISCTHTPEDLDKAADYMEKWLENRYEVYCKRDAAYVARLLKELESENGTLEFLYDGDDLAGLTAFWGLDKPEQRLLYAEDSYVDLIGETPAIMGRIVNIQSMLSAFSSKEKVELLLTVVDSQIDNNNGTFFWTLTEDGSVVRKITDSVQKEQSDKFGTPDLAAASLDAVPPIPDKVSKVSANIQDLTSWLFGYKTSSVIWPEADLETIHLLSAVDTVKTVFIDEMV